MLDNDDLIFADEQTEHEIESQKPKKVWKVLIADDQQRDP